MSYGWSPDETTASGGRRGYGAQLGTTGGRWSSPGSSDQSFDGTSTPSWEDRTTTRGREEEDYGGYGGGGGGGSGGGGGGGGGGGSGGGYGGGGLFGGDDDGDAMGGSAGAADPYASIQLTDVGKEKAKRKKREEKKKRALKKKERGGQSKEERMADKLQKLRLEREARMEANRTEADRQRAKELEKKHEDDERRRKEADRRMTERRKEEEEEEEERARLQEEEERAAGNGSSDLSDISETDFLPFAEAEERKAEKRRIAEAEEKKKKDIVVDNPAKQQQQQQQSSSSNGDGSDIASMPRHPRTSALGDTTGSVMGGSGSVLLGSVVDSSRDEEIERQQQQQEQERAQKMESLSFADMSNMLKEPVETPQHVREERARQAEEELRLRREEEEEQARRLQEEERERREKEEEKIRKELEAARELKEMKEKKEKEIKEEEEARLRKEIELKIRQEMVEAAEQKQAAAAAAAAASNLQEKNDHDDGPETNSPDISPRANTAAVGVGALSVKQAQVAETTSMSQELRYARKAQKDRWNVAHGIPPSPLREEEFGDQMKSKHAEESGLKKNSNNNEEERKEEEEEEKKQKKISSTEGAGFYTQLRSIKEAVSERSQLPESPPPPTGGSPPPRGATSSPGPPPPPPTTTTTTSRPLLPVQSTVIQEQARDYGRVQPPPVPPTPPPAQRPPLHHHEVVSAPFVDSSAANARSDAARTSAPVASAVTQVTQMTTLPLPAQPLFQDRAEALAWEMREARLEEELDRAHTELEGVHEMMTRKDSEIQRIREGAAHHRQRAVEARLELQEMRGSSALRTSRMRRSKEKEREKEKESRTFKRVDHSAQGNKNGSGTDPKDMYGVGGVPTAEELLSLEKEMQLQETLIKGYQKENERLSNTVKESIIREEESKRRMFEEHEKLSATVNNLRSRMLPEGATASSVAAHLEMDLEKDAHIRQLMEDMSELKHTHGKERETQKFEVQDLQRQLRSTKDALARSRSSTKDDTNVRRETQRTVEDLSQQLEEERHDHDEKVESLERRLKFLNDTQERLDDKSRAMSQQQHVIETLKKRLSSLERVTSGVVGASVGTSSTSSPSRGKKVMEDAGSGGSHGGRGGRSLRDVKRIKELENQLQEMAEAMRKRNPNSVAALLHAAAPPRALVEERDRLERRVKEMEAREHEESTKYEEKLTSLRQEHERMKMMYQTMQSKSSGSTRTPMRTPSRAGRGGRKSGATPGSRTLTPEEERLSVEKDDDEGMENVGAKVGGGSGSGNDDDDVQRRWYQKKIQEMQRKMENQVKAAKRGPTGEELEELRRTLREKDQTIESLRTQRTLTNGTNHVSSGGGGGGGGGNVVAADRLRSMKDLHERQLMEQADEHQATVRRLHIELRAASKALEESLIVEERSSKSPKRGKKKETKVQEEKNNDVTKQKLLTTTKLLEDRDSRLRAAHERIIRLTETNARLEVASQQPRTPTLDRMAALEYKIVRMDEKCRQRELDLQHVVDEVTQRSRQELVSLQRKNDIAIAAKNSEIQRFRMELDSLLNAVQHAKRSRSKENSP